MNPTIATVFAVLTGACIGSFLNVVIWRLPRGEGLAKGRSHCPKCGHLIRWHDNVPVLAWLWLRGRCRDCRAPISPRYPLVEALTAFLFLLVALRHDVVAETGVAAVKMLLLSALVAVSFIDADRREIPDAITKPGIAVGLLCSLVVGGLAPVPFLPELANRHLAAFLLAGLGALTGAGVLLAVRWIGQAVMKKEAMGLGDVKLLAMVGAFTRPLDVLLTLLVASVFGSLFGGIYVLSKARRLATIVGSLAVGGAPAQAFTRANIRVPRRGPPAVAALVPQAQGIAEGAKAKLALTLPATTVWADDGKDVELSLRGRVASVEPREGASLVTTNPESLSDAEHEWLMTFALNRLSIPFGVFLAVGAAAMLLYGDEVTRFMTQTWPRFVTGRGPG